MLCVECIFGELVVDWMCLKCGVCLYDKCIECYRVNKVEIIYFIILKIDVCMIFSVLDNFIDDLISI